MPPLLILVQVQLQCSGGNDGCCGFGVDGAGVWFAGAFRNVDAWPPWQYCQRQAARHEGKVKQGSVVFGGKECLLFGEAKQGGQAHGMDHQDPQFGQDGKAQPV